MTAAAPLRSLEVDLVVRELGNWRTSNRTGPVYHGLADALRLLIVDGRLPVGARLPSERALAEGLHVSRTTVTAAYSALREDGYLVARRGARSTTALPAPAGGADALPTMPTAGLSAAALSAPASAVLAAYAQAATEIAPYLQGMGHELVGITPLRAAIAERYCQRGLATDPDEIMVTTGALHAINLILRTYVHPGGRVLVEQPTYHGALAAIAASGAQTLPVPMIDDGWDLAAMQTTIAQLAPDLAYLIPDNHNPTGHTLAGDDRRQLARLIADSRTRTIVDETMSDMWLDEPSPPPLVTELTARRDLVLTVGSMSKSFWGGLRVGWIRAERSTIATLTKIRPTVDMGTAILEQLTAAKLLAMADEVLPERRAMLRSRREFLRDLLAQRLPDWQPGPGAGGLSLWVRLPAPMSTALSAAASRIGLQVPAGPRFGVDGTLERFVRLPYALPEEHLDEAVTLLARAWHSITGAAPPEPVTVVV
ncbi:GntR family transcriptional regulator [Mycolicibacterium duvalii]|uniref:GntR family transcriptional regulator n=1 Tax=Mycolicibacterium duvalii TaxID=39688 RepID=A0A7I7K262_9MYCO|nr:PLP-dependent aminotransferase family protein [Mycolicibacterium duvalii]MCV7369849.1 PLP-dependent aminotransferase family protein [Mycolicibacterium duvalii]PEG36973.1 GntR family transcriptional regulator [Mycolicibacterium duvalii]BBX17579.1 GntR family transcriptional regulator [Mycolicibacterium duvalii]